MKKMLWSLTLLAMLSSLLWGCSDNTKQNVAVSNITDNFNKQGLPIVNEPITLDVLTVRWGNMGESFTTNTWLQELEKNSNVKINWEVMSSNDWGEQKSVMLASGKLPDVIIGNMAFENSDIINNVSYFRPLDQYIDEYMPNLKAAMEETPIMRKLSTFPDGQVYSLPARLPSRPKSGTQPVINKTWLDNLKLEVPTNIDELYEVLKAFKEKDPNGNGKQDEIPVSNSGDVDLSLLAIFGITDLRGNNMLIKDGKPVYYPTSEEYKEGIKWLSKLYEEGIIDRESFTQDETMLSAKRQNPDAALIGFTSQWTPDAVFGQWSDQYITIPAIKGPDGKGYTTGEPDGLSFRRNEVLITSFNKYPEVTARWVDEFYTSEASIQNFWGAIGTSIEKHDDGTYSLMAPPEGTSADAWYWEKSLRDFGPKYVSPIFEDKIKLDPTTGDGLKKELDKLGEKEVTIPYPDVMYTTKEYQELPTLTADINSYIASTRAQWVTKGSIDSGWDAYVKQLNDMGLPQLIQIYENAYERYMSVE